MPTVEGREARVWIDEYVKKAGKLSGVAKMGRALVKKAVAGCEEYVNPWKIPTFDLNGPLCFYMVTKEHVIFGFMRGAMLRDPGKLLEGTGKYLRHAKLRSAADVRRSEVRALLEQAAELNRKEPVRSDHQRSRYSWRNSGVPRNASAPPNAVRLPGGRRNTRRLSGGIPYCLA